MKAESLSCHAFDPDTDQMLADVENSRDGSVRESLKAELKDLGIEAGVVFSESKKEASKMGAKPTFAAVALENLTSLEVVGRHRS